MIVQVDGLNLLSGAAELLDQCVDDVDEDGDASESWQDILQSLWKLSQDKGADLRAGCPLWLVSLTTMPVIFGTTKLS